MQISVYAVTKMSSGFHSRSNSSAGIFILPHAAKYIDCIYRNQVGGEQLETHPAEKRQHNCRLESQGTQMSAGVYWKAKVK